MKTPIILYTDRLILDAIVRDETISQISDKKGNLLWLKDRQAKKLSCNFGELIWGNSDCKIFNKIDSYFILLENKPIGIVKVDYNEYENSPISIACYIAPEYRNRGYAKESVNKVIKEIIKVYPSAIFIASVIKDNKDGNRLAKSIGMKEEGILRKRVKGILDVISYSLTSSEYRALSMLN